MRIRRRPEAHAPGRDAALYVQGDMGDQARRRFESHLLGCEECWTEVQRARAGRALAERGREISPPGLRDDVRAAVALSEAPARRGLRTMVPVVTAVALALIGAGVLLTGVLSGRSPQQPRPIAAALASFRSEGPPPPAPAQQLPPDLRAAGLTLVHSGRSSLGGLPVDVFRFTDGRTKVVLFLSSGRFPEAVGATERTGRVHGWRAVDNGVQLLCADAPVSYLLMGRDGSLLQRAEVALRQQMVNQAP
ncbi:MAG: hypothetical protein ACRDGU_00580 [Actinomycetota bacterium]